MIKKYCIILSIVLVANLNSQAQSMLGSTYITSLREEASNTVDDTAKVRLLNTLAMAYYHESKFDSCQLIASMALNISDSLLHTEEVKSKPDFQTAITILKVHSISRYALGYQESDTYRKVDTLLYALNLVKETGNKDEEAAIYGTLGDVYSFRNQLQLAIESYLMSVSLYKETGNKSAQALDLTGVAIVERYLGNFGDALEHLMESLEISREINDSVTVVEGLLAMGFTYLFVEKWEDALNCQKEALEICKKMNDTLAIARVYNDMGVVNMMAGNLDIALKNHSAALDIRLQSTDYFYTSASFDYIGSIYEDKGMFPEAIRNYKESILYGERSGYIIRIISSNQNIGKLYFRLFEYEKALKHFNKALELSRENDDRIGEAQASTKIAEIYLEKKETPKALVWIQKAENVIPKTAFIHLADIYQIIARVYFELGDYKNAYTNLELYSQVKDSLVVAENLEKITTLTNRLEFDNQQALQNESHEKMIRVKQAEIERQKVVKNFSLFGALVILVLAIIYFVRFIEKNKLNTKLNATVENLKSTQSQLVHAEKMASLGELTAGIAHEIQNPLNFVKNFSEVNFDLIKDLKEEVEKGDLKEVKAIADDIASNEEKIISHSNRAGSIVKGMLQHSRSGSKEKELIDINKLADEYLRLTYHGLRAKDRSFNGNFNMDFDESLPKVAVFPQEIGRVFLNLFNNAFHASAAKASETDDPDYKPIVSISTKKLGQHVEIKIKDNGGGIPAEIRDKIFQPFFTTKPSGEGTGLGLSLSYDIITKGHDGELLVETETGKGSTFIIRLPLK